MLYVTTRNNRDAYTAQRVLRETRGPDGGLYLPFLEPRLSEAEVAALGEKTFDQCVCEVLNRLFNTTLTAWDVEFTVGRAPVRLTNLPQKTILAECWYNPEWTMDAMVGSLAGLLRGGKPGTEAGWVKTAVGIAALFGIFGELNRSGVTKHGKKVDICLVAGNFDLVMSAWYARSWGLPIGNIICCCNENGNLWDLFHHGQFRTNAVSAATDVPEADVALPDGLERLICACGGTEAVADYLEVCRRGGVYCPADVLSDRLREGMEVSVVSTQRVRATIASTYSASFVLLSPGAALAYAGLQDYRPKLRESRHALVLAEKSPLCDKKTVADALGVREEQLDTRF